jgi:hypothetical protein
LKLLSRGLDLADDYLSNYLGSASADPGGEPEAVSEAPPPRPGSNLAVQRLDEIVVRRLREIVVPRMEMLESQVRELVDVIHNIDQKIEASIKHSRNTE